MQAREGDLIKTKSNVVFDVKGLVHPEGKVVAFPRFIPVAHGPRQGKDSSYGKVYSLGERFKFLKENLPDLIVFDPVFGETMCEVPVGEIAEHYKPQEKLASLRTTGAHAILETKALQLAVDLQEAADIPWSAIGISGSILAGLTTATSDIDPLVYGEENCRKAYTALQRMLKDGHPRFKPYTREELMALYEFRSKDTHMSFEDFQKVENRKAFQGMYQGTDYFVRFVKEWPELHEQYGDVCYSNAGYAKITAKVCDKSEALFTPCSYQLENVKIITGPKLEPIKEVASFRGRFCEQAENGETITAQGKAEQVTDKRSGDKYYRLILGGKPEDYMVLGTVERIGFRT
jgi:predicted nucleotidyltransferase